MEPEPSHLGFVGFGFGVGSFPDEEDEPDTEGGGDERDEEEWAEPVPDQLVEAESDERADDGAGGVRGPVEAESTASIGRRRVVCNQRVPRRSAHAFPHAICEPADEDKWPPAGKSDERLADRRDGVAGGDQGAAPAEVGQTARPYLRYRCRGFGHTFDEPKNRGRRTQHRRDE